MCRGGFKLGGGGGGPIHAITRTGGACYVG